MVLETKSHIVTRVSLQTSAIETLSI